MEYGKASTKERSTVHGSQELTDYDCCQVDTQVGVRARAQNPGEEIGPFFPEAGNWIWVLRE